MTNYLNIFEKEQSQFMDNRVNYNPDFNNLHSRAHTVIADLIRNPEVKGRAYNKTTQPTEPPLP